MIVSESSFLLCLSILSFLIQTGALEHIVKASQLEIIELQHSVDELRYLIIPLELTCCKQQKCLFYSLVVNFIFS